MRSSRNSCIIRFQPVRSSSQPEILRGSLLLSISMGDFAVMGESDIKKDSSPELPTPPVAYQGRGSRLQDIIQRLPCSEPDYGNTHIAPSSGRPGSLWAKYPSRAAGAQKYIFSSAQRFRRDRDIYTYSKKDPTPLHSPGADKLR